MQSLKRLTFQAIKSAVLHYPRIKGSLNAQARYIAATPTAYKTYDYFVSELSRAVTNVYNGRLGGEFIEILSGLLQGQIIQAFFKAWEDEGGDGETPDYLKEAAESQIIDQESYVENYYQDIIDARVDGTSLEPLLARARIWATNYNDAYNEGVRLIALENGDKLEWIYSPEKDHCPQCEQLNGIVAFASEWDTLDVKPGGFDNWAITCKGYNCGCELRPTEKRRSPKAFDVILNIVTNQ